MAMEEEEDATVAVRNPSHHVSRPCKIKRASDLITIYPKKFFTIYSLLFPPNSPSEPQSYRNDGDMYGPSHVWFESRHLFWTKDSIKSINKTLANYKATKITSFHLYPSLYREAHHDNSWIEFAMSHNVENLSLSFDNRTLYNFPEFVYNNSSLKQLLVSLRCCDLIPTSIVSWTSLRKLSLKDCKLSDESFLKIPSGCPILESLRLDFCNSLTYLDLSQSLFLRRLEVEFGLIFGQSLKIVAPHIYYLKLRNFDGRFTLVDVSSLTEADVEVIHFKPKTYDMLPLKPDALLAMVETLIEKFQNVVKLSPGVNFLQILSLYKIPRLPFPTLKVKTLTLETMIVRSVVPGIARLLQNSPDLNKLSVYMVNECSLLLENCVNEYLDSQDFNSEKYWRSNVIFPSSWRYENVNVVGPDLMASFIDFLLENTRTIETLVVQLGSCTKGSRFEEMLQMARTFYLNNKVSVLVVK